MDTIYPLPKYILVKHYVSFYVHEVMFISEALVSQKCKMSKCSLSLLYFIKYILPRQALQGIPHRPIIVANKNISAFARTLLYREYNHYSLYLPKTCIPPLLCKCKTCKSDKLHFDKLHFPGMPVFKRPDVFRQTSRHFSPHVGTFEKQWGRLQHSGQPLHGTQKMPIFALSVKITGLSKN